MRATAAQPRGRFSRGVRILVLGLVCLLVTAAFAMAMFPAERLAPRLARELEQALGAEVTIGALDGGWSVGGPSLHAEQVALRWPDASVLEIERLWARPAWSPSWLRGRPALRVQLGSPAARVAGTLWPGASFAFEGTAKGLNPVALPPALLGGLPPVVQGRLDLDVSVRSGPSGALHGALALDARDGLLLLPDLPIAIPYDTLRGALSRAENGETVVRALQLEGPLLSLDAEGTIGTAPVPERAPLHLELTLREVDAAAGSLLDAFGVAPQPGGGTPLLLTGTLGRPVVRRR